ncbi:MAG TPA: VanW family protein, partial [Thermoleophilia bacterium]|nr:VanW family protein [Thermoleophilia bacterium]
MLVSVVVIVLCVALFGWLQLFMRDRAAYGAKIASFCVSGASRVEAERRLARAQELMNTGAAMLVTPTGLTKMKLADLGFSVDVPATVDEAIEGGRLDVLGLQVYWGRVPQVEPAVRFDAAAFGDALDKLRPLVEKPPRDAALVLDGRRVRVRPAREGTTIDRAAFERRLVDSLVALRQYAGPVPTAPAPPAVSTAQAQLAAEQAHVYLQRPIVLRYRERRIELAPGLMALMLSVNGGDDAAEHPLTFKNAAARRELHRLFAFAETPPVDARVVFKGDEAHVTRSRDGFMLDMGRLLSDMDAAAVENGLRTVIVALGPVAPRVSTDLLLSDGLDAIGSRFSTYFDPDNRNRAQNIALAARYVDSTLVKDGSEFSLNATLGPRTVNRGFDYAPIISGGVFRQGVGGGICQFATTLFNAAFFYGLPISERYPHPLYIDHYPVGRDATVAWGGADLKFRNDTGSPLMIRAWAKHGELTVVIVGNAHRKVTSTTSKFFDLRPPASSKASPRVVYDDQLSRGIV